MKLTAIALMLMLNREAAEVRVPQIHSPVDGQEIGAEGDKACTDPAGCWQIEAKGSVPRGRAGIFAVEPVRTSPAVWVQPFPPGAAGGTITATVHLGQKHVGAKQSFRIYLLSCAAEHELVAGETSFEEIARFCKLSEAVTVYRVR